MINTGIESKGPCAAYTTGANERVLHTLSIPAQHLRLTQVLLQDATDDYNELVQTREWLLHPSNKHIALPGNLFVIEETLTGNGWIVLKTLPLPHARPRQSPADLRVVPPHVLPGFTIQVITSDPDEDPANTVILTYTGGVLGRTRALHAFQQTRHSGVNRIPRFLSNTWGDRSCDSRVCESFLLAEIEAAARLGVDVVQIDDGWQQGSTSNSAQAVANGGVWEGFWKANPDFWKPHATRLPRGLAPIADAARKNGVRLGIWFAPDSTNHFANWERDAAVLLDLHREYHVEHFKIDGVRTPTVEAGANLGRFFERLRLSSQGRIVIDLDVTASIRPGYFGALDAGVMFVENRYTDWHNYWPHQTLRNLWNLTHWIDPRRLRMEWLNHARHTKLYADDPLAPAQYTPDALFATVMFSNPLGWFEVSHLPENYFTDAAPLVATWRKARERLFSGTILPVGEEPDGVAWTGFVSLADDACDLLAFRESNANERHVFQVPGLAEGLRHVKIVAGGGSAKIVSGGLDVSIPKTLGYLWVRVMA